MINIESLKKPTIAKIKKGRDGKPIGVVIDPLTKAGMIVLFSSPTPREGSEVVLVDFIIRKSNRTGKEYIKCFKWITREQYEKLYNEYLERESVKELKKYNIPSEFYSLAIVNQDLPAMQLLYKSIKPRPIVILYTHGRYLVVFNNLRYMLIKIHWTEKVEIVQGQLPIEFLPDKYYSETHGIIVIDDAFEYFDVAEISKKLVEKGIPSVFTAMSSPSLADLTIVLPKEDERLKKVLAIKSTEMPKFTKILCYLEVFGLKPEDVGIDILSRIE